MSDRSRTRNGTQYSLQPQKKSNSNSGEVAMVVDEAPVGPVVNYDINEYKTLLNDDQAMNPDFVAAINANTSFVTTYPILFPFPASENVFLISRLYQLHGAPPVGMPLTLYVTTTRLFDFFTTSMNQIRDYIIQPNVEKCIVGLEEQNNTMAVNSEYQRVVDQVTASQQGTNCVYLTKNIWDDIGGTYPSCALIIKGFGNMNTFADVNPNFHSQIWKNSRTPMPPAVAGYVGLNTVPASLGGPLARVSPLNMLCYSVYPFQIPGDFQPPFPPHAAANEPIDNSKKLGTRDLGDFYEANELALNGITFLKNLLPNGYGCYCASPDSGRPIIVALQRNEADGPVTNVFICVHMLNASLCKRYRKISNNPQQFEPIAADNNQTVLQLIGDPAISAAWNTFCLASLQRHLEAILRDDFGLTDANFNDNTAFYMCGDFNDPTGNIMTALENQGITLFGLNVRFKFGKNNQNNFPITGCPNTNSSLAQGPNPVVRPAVGNNFASLFAAINNQGDPNLIATMQASFITANPASSILNPNLFAFIGDETAEGSTNNQLLAGINALVTDFLNFNDLRTDHLIPVVRFTRNMVPMDFGGGRRRRRSRRRSARRKSYKRYKGHKRRRYTKKGRRRARHSRKR
jgi:hypothetical protein